MEEKLTKEQMKEMMEEGQERIDNLGGVELKWKNWNYFKNLKIKEKWLIKGLIPNKSLSMMYGEPKTFKSLLSLRMMLSLEAGKPFLNKFKTKKTNCLYIDVENTDKEIKDRLKKIKKSYKTRLKPNQLTYICRDSRGVDVLNDYFYSDLKNRIQENNIRFLIIDTLPKVASYDSNQEKDVNNIYNKFFRELIEETNISILFLLHKTKKGNSFIGSQAYLGIVDCAYEICKTKNNLKVKVQSDNRGENPEPFHVEFEFSDKEIKSTYSVAEKETIPLPKLKELTQKVEDIIKVGEEYKKQQIIFNLVHRDVTIGKVSDGADYSDATLKRSLKFLIDNKIIAYDAEKRIYYKK